MATVTTTLACGCFRRGEYAQEQSFSSAQEAKDMAIKMIKHMNNSYCGKHIFSLDDHDPEALIINAKNRYE